MGVRGLTTYIHNRAELYLHPFELHDTFLVIDGYSIACQLYSWLPNSNCAFGGDYTKYAQCVKKFFTNLSKCNITPLVVLDGGAEDKKIQTLMQRQSDRIDAAKSYTPLCQNELKFFPALLNNVYRNVLLEMNIRYIQCLSEADDVTAALAKFLNCPVLSSDSDFFIYGVLFIPFNTIDFHALKKWRNYVISCKIYKISNLLNSFPGLHESMLPLAATLIGNDYVEYSIALNIFRHFYNKIKLPKFGRLNCNQQQCRIEGTLNWLSNQKLYSAVCLVMQTVPHNYKLQTVRIMLQTIKEYNDVSVNVLHQLNFSKEEIDQISLQKIQNNSNSQIYNDYKKCQEMLENMLGNTKNQVLNENKCEAETKAIINSLPTWFIEEFSKGLLPPYFLDLLIRDLFICVPQIEDYSRPPSLVMSIPILNVIYTLLKSGRERKKGYGDVLTRGENNGPRVVRYHLEYVDSIFSSNSLSLDNLRETSLIVRKDFFDVTLCVQKHITEFPINWRLYIIVTKYWADHLSDLRSDSHIYALLFAMLYHIIIAKVGYFKSSSTFYTKYQTELKELQSQRQKTKNDASCSTNISIMEALAKVTKDDCILFAKFFINNSEMDPELLKNPKKFRVSIVDIFARFQFSLMYIFDLNKLLGYVYKHTSISDMYNGTLMYNLYNNFKQRGNIESYINSILQCSPTLLQLFNVILIKIKLMINLRPCNNKKSF